MEKPCTICGQIDEETVSEGLCDRCWYGQRLDPDAWIKELASEGIEVEKTGGCHVMNQGTVIFCTDPYTKKD